MIARMKATDIKDMAERFTRVYGLPVTRMFLPYDDVREFCGTDIVEIPVEYDSPRVAGPSRETVTVMGMEHRQGYVGVEYAHRNRFWWYNLKMLDLTDEQMRTILPR